VVGEPEFVRGRPPLDPSLALLTSRRGEETRTGDPPGRPYTLHSAATVRRVISSKFPAAMRAGLTIQVPPTATTCGRAR